MIDQPVYTKLQPRETPSVLAHVEKTANTMLDCDFRLIVVHHPWDWAVYFGPSAWSAQRIAAEGEKLPRVAALVMFPGIAGLYRE